MRNSLQLFISMSFLSGVYLTSCSNTPTTATDTTATNSLVSTTMVSQNVPAWQDWQKAEILYTLWGHSQPITQVTFSQGNLLASSDGLEIVVWDTQTGESQAILPGHRSTNQGGTYPAPITSLAFSPNGQMLAWTGQPPTFPYPILRLWQMSERTLEDPYTGEDIYRRDRANYDPLPLNFLTSNSAPILIGSNPQEVVLNVWGLSEYRASSCPCS